MVPKYEFKGIEFYFIVIAFLGIVLDIEKWNANNLQENKD